MTSGRQIVRDCRFLLGDLPEKSSTSSVTWESEEILTLAQQARDTLVKVIWGQQRSMQQPFQLTLSRMVKSFPITQSLPADFWKLICAVTSTGEYLPADVSERAYGLIQMGDRLVTIVNGVVVYPSDVTDGLTYYVALPSDVLTENDVALPNFSDSFYECVVLMTCIGLLGKREREAADRLQFLAKAIATTIPTLL